MVSDCEVLVGFRTWPCEGAILVTVGTCEGRWCITIYETHMLSCSVACSSLFFSEEAS